MASTTIAVSVIIPNHNSPVIDEVLTAVRTQARELSHAWEAWIVGQDRSELVQASENVHLIELTQPAPPARARNIGATTARGDVLVFLDADCVPQPGWLIAMLEAMARWPDAGAVSGAMLPDGDTLVRRCGQVAVFHEHLTLNPAGSRSTLASFSLLVPRPVWQSVGGFDEQFQFAAAEDLDLSIRIAQAGHRLYFEPRAAVRHKPQRNSWRALWRHALIGGSQSIQVRRQYADYYRLPRWIFSAWWWALLSPAIAIGRTAQIYANMTPLWRYWYFAPWVILSKLAWCWGAAVGLAWPSAVSRSSA